MQTDDIDLVLVVIKAEDVAYVSIYIFTDNIYTYL